MSLSKREKTLMFLVVGTIGLVLNLWFVVTVIGSLRESHAEISQANLLLKNSRPLLEESERWKERGDWLRERLPEMNDQNQARVALFKDAETSAKDLGIELRNPQFIDLVTVDPATKLGVDFELRGPWQKILRAIYDLHHPENFTIIENLTIQRQGREEEGSVSANVRLSRLFRQQAPDGI